MSALPQKQLFSDRSLLTFEFIIRDDSAHRKTVLPDKSGPFGSFGSGIKKISNSIQFYFNFYQKKVSECFTEAEART